VGQDSRTVAAASIRGYHVPVLRAGRGIIGLRATGAVPNEDEGLTLTAYDQLVLSIRALTVGEIKQELTTRGVSFDDCFEKEALVARLTEARLQLAAEAIGEGGVDVDETGTVQSSPLEKKEDSAAQEPSSPVSFVPVLLRRDRASGPLSAGCCLVANAGHG